MRQNQLSRFLILTLVLLACVNSFSQITIREVISVSKTDKEKFEIFALNKGFSFHSVTDVEMAMLAIEPDCDFNCNERYLSLTFKPVGLWSKQSYYATTYSNELVNWYSELASLGFKLEYTRENETEYIKHYIRGERYVEGEEITLTIESGLVSIWYIKW